MTQSSNCFLRIRCKVGIIIKQLSLYENLSKNCEYSMLVYFDRSRITEFDLSCIDLKFYLLQEKVLCVQYVTQIQMAGDALFIHLLQQSVLPSTHTA